MSTSISPQAPEQVKEKAKSRKPRKPLYEVAEGEKLDKTPEDYNPDTHRLTPAQFTDRPAYMEHQALMYEQKATKLREDAAAWRLNPPKPGEKRKKLMARLSKLEAKLKELGVDVEDLFAEDEASE